MNPFRRVREILAGIAHAFRFDNPFEYLLNWHLLRRRDPLILRHAGFAVCVNAESSDAHVAAEILIHGMYDAAIRDAAEGRARFGYLNLGANIGVFDVRVAQLVRLPTVGLAVELNPFAHARLLLNLELNRLHHVHALNAGASSGPGSLRLVQIARDTGQVLPPPSEGKEGWPVPLVGWRELVTLLGEDQTIDLLKVDIEGSEAAFLEGFAEHARRRVRRAVIESHGPKNHAAVERFFAEAGFAIVRRDATGASTLLTTARNSSLL